MLYKNTYLLLIALIVHGCSPLPEIEQTQNTVTTPIQMRNSEAVETTETLMDYKNEIQELECAGPFDHRELREPYQRQHENEARFTLSSNELEEYFSLMGIRAVCIPQEFGAPFLSVDWNSNTNPSVTGRMISISFEELYPGAGWGDSYIVYSTYDFQAGTEYDRFASIEDLQSLQNGNATNVIEANGVEGFKRFQPGLGYEHLPIFMTYTYPFATSYVAFVFRMGDFEGEIEPVVENFKKGEYPTEISPMIKHFELMAQTVDFVESH